MKRLFILMLFFSVGLPLNIYAQQADEPGNQSRIAQRLFETADEAVKALQTAALAKDQTALRAIFGPHFQELLTGDSTQDEINAAKFAKVLAQGYQLQQQTDSRVIIEVGSDHWPMPIPLVRINGFWLFDTLAGKDEIINRHIGKDELHAIGICRAYVRARLRYANLKLQVPKPVHGYVFKSLIQHDKAFPALELKYLNHGRLTDGFALVAYPVLWGQSGVMTFIINQDGHLYQQDLGENTAQIIAVMNEYDPDGQWALVQDQGVLSEGVK